MGDRLGPESASNPLTRALSNRRDAANPRDEGKRAEGRGTGETGDTGERASARTADVGAVPANKEPGATDVKGSQGKKPQARRLRARPDRRAGTKGLASIPEAFASGYPSSMRTATHNLT